MILRIIAIQAIKFFSRITIPTNQEDEKWQLECPYIEVRDFQIQPISISENICLTISKIVISENLLPTVPDIYECPNLPLNSVIIIDFNYFVKLDRPEIKSYDNAIKLLLPSISQNLLKPFQEPKIDGKIFNRQIDVKTNKPQKIVKVRKANTQVQGMNEWDLLYPSLCPPVVFDFDDMDFFQPLRGYQIEGINFLVMNTFALLADEMGTGKTVQTVNALRILFRQGSISCALIICPLAVIGSAYLSRETGKSEGWDGHLYNWAKELLVTVIRDNPEQRKIDWKAPAHIYITTYDTLRNDLNNGILQETDLRKFNCVVLDEAQKIKNKNSQISKAVHKLLPKYRWALTGTPIENGTKDVISIFEFVKPSLFSKVDYLPEQVNSMIKPYMLRRLKRHVLEELPPKISQEDWLELDSKQKQQYENALNTGRRQLESSIKTHSNFQVRKNIFKLIGDLKKICNFASGEATSPKTELLIEYIETIVSNEEKVLVFSQYKGEGINKIENIFNEKRIGFVQYNGDMSESQRSKAVSDFRSRSDIYVFLATIQSAGTGLTLTEASYIMHFDHLWNPATMKQAEDRAHRLGQKNTLTVYSFWMKDTIEEKIRKKLYEKGLLSESVIDSLAEEGINNKISTEEWLDIFGVKAKPEQSTKEGKSLSLQSNIESIDASTDSTKLLIDFAIITAIETERKAVCEAFAITEQHRVPMGTRVYWRKRIELKNGKYYEIVVAQLPDMSNVEAALMATDMIRDWQPESMLMVGIAGAARPNQQLGDLIIAKDIYYYERGKETPDGRMPEPIMYRADATLWSRVTSAAEWKEPILIARPDNKIEDRPNIHYEAIASGERVIADAAVRDEIASKHRKIMAFEMEGYGMSAAAWQSADRVKHLVIRAICDFADSSKNSAWHSYAAAVAAGYTKHFLLDMPLEPRNLSG